MWEQVEELRRLAAERDEENRVALKVGVSMMLLTQKL